MLTINDKIRLYFSDHRGRSYYDPSTPSGSISTLSIESLLKSTNAKNLIVSSPENATHCFVHLADNERDKARVGEWPDSIKTNQIILCLTTGEFDPATYLHRFDEIDGFGRATLFCRDLEPLKDVQAFITFCEIGIAQAKAITEGDMSVLPPNLRRIFSKTLACYMSALAILCQSYLVLHVSADSKLHQGAKDIRGALEDMGFWVVPGKAEPIPLPADFKQKVKAMTGQWWTETLTSGESGEADEKARTVAARIQKEWEGLTNSGSKGEQQAEYDWGDLDALLSAVGLTDSKTEDTASSEQAAPEPTLVARAYRAIRSVLVASS